LTTIFFVIKYKKIASANALLSEILTLTYLNKEFIMTRINPIALNSLFDVEKIMEGLFSQKPNFNYPVMDVYSSYRDEDNDIIYEIAVPGIAPKDISVEVNDERGVIRVSQNSEKEEEVEDKHYYMKRIGKRKFDIGLHLPSTHKLENDSVSIQHGVLKIVLTPKEEPDNKIRKIEPKLLSQ
jgi:HSP20 family molecular chaperone IbpA